MDRKINYIAINNNVEESRILDCSYIQQIMVDTETIGKIERQRGLSTVINNHNISDVGILKQQNLKAEIICRINPYNPNIENEINEVIENKADAIMLPMIKSVDHYKKMQDIVADRVKVIPLIETPYSVFKLEEILRYKPLQQIHFGLNDLFIALGFNNLFEILFSKTFIDTLTYTRERVDVMGVGGVGTPFVKQIINPLLLIKEFAALKCNSVILSRSFFKEGYLKDDIVKGIECLELLYSSEYLEVERKELRKEVENFIVKFDK